MKHLRLKIICGFRQDQAVTIDASEAHKAYKLFYNPEMRGVFSNGVAMTGRDIVRIEPDFVGCMGWNAGHFLTPDDWNEIRASGVEREIREAMQLGGEVGRLQLTPAQMNTPLQTLVAKEFPKLLE